MRSSISVLRSNSSCSQIISQHLKPHIIRCHFFSSRLGNHEGQAKLEDRSWHQRPTRRSTLPAGGRRAKRRTKKRLQSHPRRHLRVSSSSRSRSPRTRRCLPVLALELKPPQEVELARDRRLLRVNRGRTPRVQRQRLSTIVRSTSLSSRAASSCTLRR